MKGNRRQKRLARRQYESYRRTVESEVHKARRDLGFSRNRSTWMGSHLGLTTQLAGPILRWELLWETSLLVERSSERPTFWSLCKVANDLWFRDPSPLQFATAWSIGLHERGYYKARVIADSFGFNLFNANEAPLESPWRAKAREAREQVLLPSELEEFWGPKAAWESRHWPYRSVQRDDVIRVELVRRPVGTPSSHQIVEWTHEFLGMRAILTQHIS